MSEGKRFSRREALGTVVTTVGAGLAGCTATNRGVTTTTTTAAGGSPDVLTVIGYPASGKQLFADYYGNRTGDQEDVLVPDGMRDTSLQKSVDASMTNLTGTAPTASGPNEDAFVDLFEEEYGTEPGIFTAHTFDAVAILLLANAAAGENTGSKIKDQMRRVANDSGTSYGPDTLAEAVDAAARGEEVDYRGASSEANFDDRGDPASASYEVWEFASGGGIETLDTVSFSGSAGGSMADSSPGGTDRTLKLGMLLPVSGDLKAIGKSLRDAGELAVQQVETGDASVEVDTAFKDTETSSETGLSAANDLIDEGYPCFVGPAGSGVNIPVSKQAFVPNEVVGCSPSSTALSVSFLEDDGYVFRTAPSDLLQGKVLAKVAAKRLGADTTATMYIDNDYGRQLSDKYTSTFGNQYDGTVETTVPFEKEQDSYTTELDTALSN